MNLRSIFRALSRPSDQHDQAPEYQGIMRGTGGLMSGFGELPPTPPSSSQQHDKRSS